MNSPRSDDTQAMRLVPDFIAAGGNRHPSAADWAPELLAFGTGNHVALWNPDASRPNGIVTLLIGHTDLVNAVKIYSGNDGQSLIISGSADNTVRIWKAEDVSRHQYTLFATLSHHKGSINTISLLLAHNAFITGAADGTVKVWTLSETEVQLSQDICLQPRYLPLTSAAVDLADGITALVVAGTSNYIQVYISLDSCSSFVLQATLTGHEGWIRSLDFAALGLGSTHQCGNSKMGRVFMLASASQDKYVRLWRFSRGTDGMSNDEMDLESLAAPASLSNKVYQIGSSNIKFTVSYEALLIGHEDWVYTARWSPITSQSFPLALLSASADNSLSVWQADKTSGIWVCQTRLGEISSQKGSTTATGSTGGFWNGLWQPVHGNSVASLSGTGSWRIWSYEGTTGAWNQRLGISGHTEAVQDLSWSPDGSYLLTTSSDQTSRLFSEAIRGQSVTWHEVARPQIHGYDLNCITAITTSRFVSGADEKLLRVFDMPRSVGSLLSNLSGAVIQGSERLPDVAQIPVLGLSNTAVPPMPVENDGANTYDQDEAANEVNESIATPSKSPVDSGHPPFEDHLARHTLWPEHEKLYGHGYEISAAAASHNGKVIATACKASSIDHAVVRLYDAQTWREVKPSLTAHSLTVTALAFSNDDRYLLSVGRDRQWALFQREGESSIKYRIHTKNPKGHSRMILGCAFAPIETQTVFATAGRDKMVKIWQISEATVSCIASLSVNAPVTAISFSMQIEQNACNLAYGTEEGFIYIAKTNARILETNVILSPATHQRSKAITALQWRPMPRSGLLSDAPSTNEGQQLAVASEDFSVRICTLNSSVSDCAVLDGHGNDR